MKIPICLSIVAWLMVVLQAFLYVEGPEEAKLIVLVCFVFCLGCAVYCTWMTLDVIMRERKS